VIEGHGLTRSFRRGRRHVAALRGVDVAVPRGGAVSVIGESGSGKTTLARVLAGLEPFDGGRLLIDGVDVTDPRPRARSGRHRRVQLVHQDPYSALNPTRTVRSILHDPLRLRAVHTGRPPSWVDARARELLVLVGLEPADVLPLYPHQLSGGMRQRVVVARALTVDPGYLIADEAVSMVDVSLRLGILRLLRDLSSRVGVGVLFITHDIAAARYLGGELYVLYRGEVVERGPVQTLLSTAVHPYTQCLLSAVPVLHGLEEPGAERLEPTGPLDERVHPAGCLFSPRCRFASLRCVEQRPVLGPYGDETHHHHACHHPSVRHVTALPRTPS
jgi:peptide/nickel transport system ATP-binding protein